jgi:hypothetical protein
MAAGVFDSRNFKQKNTKKPEVKILFFLDLFLTNVLELYLVKDFNKNMLFKAIFHPKSRRGGGLSQGVLLASY